MDTNPKQALLQNVYTQEEAIGLKLALNRLEVWYTTRNELMHGLYGSIGAMGPIEFWVRAGEIEAIRTALSKEKPTQAFSVCPACGTPNDSALPACAYCGLVL